MTLSEAKQKAIRGDAMDTLHFVNQWARSPKPSNPEISAQKAAMFAQMVNIERRKHRAMKRRGRWLDRSGCSQMKFL